jgi:hypothetical protein
VEGSDFKDVSLEACQNLCKADRSCTFYTWNQRTRVTKIYFRLGKKIRQSRLNFFHLLRFLAYKENMARFSVEDLPRPINRSESVTIICDFLLCFFIVLTFYCRCALLYGGPSLMSVKLLGPRRTDNITNFT